MTFSRTRAVKNKATATATSLSEKAGVRPDLFGGHEVAFEALVENALVGVGFHVGRTLVWANQKMADMLGYEQHELIGVSVRLFYASRKDYLEVGREYQRLTSPQGYVHERKLKRKNGEVLWCLISGKRINPTDSKSPSVWVLQDITARKLAEEALTKINEQLEQQVQARTLKLQNLNRSLLEEVSMRRAMELELLVSREKYQAIFRNLSVGIVVTDFSGRIVEVNRSMHAYAGTRELGAFLEQIQVPEAVIQADATKASLMAFLERIAPSEPRSISRAQISWVIEPRSRDFSVVASRLSSGGLGVAYIFEDITEQKLAREREMEQRQSLAHGGRLALMGQMATTLAHELGQPLNVSQSYLASIRYRLKSELSERPDVLEAFELAERHLEQAGQIVRSVRSFVSLRQTPPTQVNMKEWLDRTLALLAPRLRSSRTHVELDIPKTRELPWVRANSVEIQQVLMNLMVNAMDAMQEARILDKTILIRIRRERGRRVCVTVADNGPGVQVRPASKVFDDYFTTKARGLGMGLAISRTIVESHDGELRLTRVKGWPGAAFRFTLCAEGV